MSPRIVLWIYDTHTGSPLHFNLHALTAFQYGEDDVEDPGPRDLMLTVVQERWFKMQTCQEPLHFTKLRGIILKYSWTTLR